MTAADSARIVELTKQRSQLIEACEFVRAAVRDAQERGEGCAPAFLLAAEKARWAIAQTMPRRLQVGRGYSHEWGGVNDGRR